MDANLIYIKTPQGDEAVRQRTRVVQRNVRMVLILVDGYSTVGDLCAKTGNQKLTENALNELENAGLIELRLEHDSIWAESKKVAEEIRSAVIGKAAQPTGTPPPAPIPVLQTVVEPLPQAASPPEQAVVPPAMPGKQEQVFQSAEKTKKRVAKPVIAAWAERARTGLVRCIDSLRSARTSNETLKISPRRGRKSMAGLLFSVVAALLLLGFLTLILFPYDRYLPEIETGFRQASGKDLKVGGLRLNFYPKPALVLQNVAVGHGSGKILVREIFLQPELSSVFSTHKSVRNLILSGVSLTGTMLADLRDISDRIGRSGTNFRIKNLSFENTDVSFSGMGLEGLAGEASFSEAGEFKAISLHSADRSLSVVLKPALRRVDVSLEGYSWRPVQGSPFLFDSLTLNGSLEGEKLVFGDIELRIFDGLVKGTAVFRGGGSPGLSGEIFFERINANRLSDALGIGAFLSGETAGRLTYAMQAASWAELFSSINGEGEFSTRRGSVRGIDMAEAVRRTSRVPVQGGVTSFETLSGKMRLSPDSYQFDALVLNSGLMQSTGNLSVGKEMALRGRMEMQMRGSVNQMRVPVTLGGSLKMPSVQAVRH